MTANEPIIEVESLEKQYRGSSLKAINSISFKVERGDIFGLIGPNGAGKSTTLGVLTTRVLPTHGRALVNRINVVDDPVSVKSHIAVVPQRNNLDRGLTAIENLTFHAAYFGIGRAARRQRALELLDNFGLAERANEKVDRYSGGMVQRLLIARALMHVPDILFLDEPTAALDPQSRLFLWDAIEALNRNGLTIVLTTHDMEEAAKLCHHIAIIDRGKIMALDTLQNLSALAPTGTRIELRVRTESGVPFAEEAKASILTTVGSLPGVTKAEWGTTPLSGGESLLRLYARQGSELAMQVARIVLNQGLELTNLHLVEPSLEDVFIHLTGRELRN